ncbi:Type VI secretion protein IcmF C-terminal [Syntrophus gentianae]|uniref:Type VI secretion protein IcmF C-terminal n=1 Tax=Syntrophus gentianae TaxID=43775 RepID=A0A1H7VJN1_9BACT|nr:hypothetical protein [Syntrophus gentianae]SEM09234.1 Type VI secretion protein IcmF C-terminal [Syntrophus gentianae]
MDLLPWMTGSVRNFFSVDNWPYLLAAVAVLGVLILAALLVYYLIRKRRKARGENKPAESDIGKTAAKKAIPPSSLARIWKDFLKEIPWSIRPNILAYEHFIVFGEAGSGKSALIDNYTDWQGRARQFYPSYTTNPLLQIYLGSKVLIQEIPAALLDDTSEDVRRALLKLWKPLFRRHDPTVVIVLNGAEFQTDDPEYLEYLKQKAQMIRGKINLLGNIRKKPVKVRIVLTLMDQIEGFSEFSQFLTGNDIPLKLEFRSKTDFQDISERPDALEEKKIAEDRSKTNIKDLSGCLDPYEEHLTRALLSLPADQYLKAITFMRQGPKLFQDLSVFIKFLQNPDPLSLEPEVTQFYLTSQVEGEPSVLNPFAPSLTAREIKKIDPYFKHRVAAAAIGFAGLAFLGAAYFHGRSLVVERYRTLARVEAFPPARYDQKIHEILPSVYVQQHPLMNVFPDFFPEINREITNRCMDNIRRFYLLPGLDRLCAATTVKSPVAAGRIVTIRSIDQQYRGTIDEAQDKAVYLLALIYATRNNELGKLIRHNSASWSQILNLSKEMIEDYVHNNESSAGVSLAGKRISFSPSQGTVEDPRRWMVYFTEIGRLYRQPVLSRSEFERLQKETDQFLGMIQQLELYDLTVRLAELLRKEIPSDINLEMISHKESELRQEAIKNFLNFIKNSNISYPEVVERSGFTGLLENLKAMLAFKEPQGVSNLSFSFSLGGEAFSFSAQQWQDLLNRSRISLLLREFVNRHKNQDGLLFFPSDQEFGDLVMNASNDGRFLFIGHARVDGRFTKEAIEKRVRPMLTELPDVIARLPVSPEDKSYFSNFLFKEIDIYGRRYAQSFRKYYLEFDIKAGSPAALRFVLSQMVLPSSPLREVLVNMMDNTLIDPGKNEYMQAFVRNLAEFEFIRRLMGEQKGTFPELDRYKVLIEQMLADIQEQQEPAEKKDREDPYAQFKTRLSPLGRISFAIFNNEKDSYVNLVKLWLDSVAVPRGWQDIFLAPVWQAYFLGMGEIETEMAKTWKELWQTDIQPLYSKFPFSSSSGEEVSVDELRNATHPAGHFWQTYQAMFSPFCKEEGRRWKKKNGPYNVPKLPNNLLTALNAASQLSAVLWDKEGKERPLEFMVRPKPLPAVLPNEPTAALSYLQAGESVVFGFNQKPSWKKIKVNWQSPYWAAVGMEFTTRDKPVRIKRSIEIPSSNWAFYRLLQKAEGPQGAARPNGSDKGIQPAGSGYNPANGKKAGDFKTYSWVIRPPAIDGQGRSMMNVLFDIQNDPWAIFIVPR